MFQDLDTTLNNIFADSAAPARLVAAEVSFATPEKGYAPKQGNTAINLFLYEVRENRELRDPAPIRREIGNAFVQARPPVRVDCAYLVTSWSKTQTEIADEHELLALAFAWLSRFPVIPDKYLAGSLIGQPYPPPALLAQWDWAKNVGEFWTALGIPPRPFFNLIVPVAMDLDQAAEDFMVTTVATTYRNVSGTSAEELMIIGGTVRDHAGNAVSQAWVRLDPAGAIQVADASGRFIFMNVRRGTGYSLQALAPGHAQPAVLGNFEIPSLSGNYDLQFT